MLFIEEENLNNENAEVVEETEANNEVENVTDEAVEEVKNDESARIVVNKPDENEEPYDVTIENSRKKLFGEFSKSRKVSNIITAVILVIAIVAMLLITQQDSLMTLFGWILAGGSLIGLIVYYMVNKNKFPNKTREYIKELTLKLNENTFKDERFNNVSFDPAEKLNVEDVIGDSVYENLGAIASRNVVKGNYNEDAFLYAEAALSKANATKKEGPVFVGKYISLPNKLELRGRIIINLKKKESPVDLPSSIGNLDVLEENEEMVIYGFKDTDVKAVLGTLFLSKIKDLMPNEHLMNTNIVVWAGKTGFYLSYDDAIMGLPFDKPFDRNTNDSSVKDVVNAFECNEALGK